MLDSAVFSSSLPAGVGASSPVPCQIGVVPGTSGFAGKRVRTQRGRAAGPKPHRTCFRASMTQVSNCKKSGANRKEGVSWLSLGELSLRESCRGFCLCFLAVAHYISFPQDFSPPPPWIWPRVPEKNKIGAKQEFHLSVSWAAVHLFCIPLSTSASFGWIVVFMPRKGLWDSRRDWSQGGHMSQLPLKPVPDIVNASYPAHHHPCAAVHRCYPKACDGSPLSTG